MTIKILEEFPLIIKGKSSTNNLYTNEPLHGNLKIITIYNWLYTSLQCFIMVYMAFHKWPVKIDKYVLYILFTIQLITIVKIWLQPYLYIILIITMWFMSHDEIDEDTIYKCILPEVKDLTQNLNNYTYRQIEPLEKFLLW